MERRSSYRALVVEDDESILKLVKIVLERENFIVEGVKNGVEAINLLREIPYELLVIDLTLPLINGDEVLAHLELTQPEALRRVIVTTASPRQLSCEFLEKICRLLTKPFDVDQLALYARECTVDENPVIVGGEAEAATQ